MTTLDTRRPADLTTKTPAQIVPVVTRRQDRPLQDPNGRYYARRGGPTGRAVFLLLAAVVFTALFAGFFLSLLQQP